MNKPQDTQDRKATIAPALLLRMVKQFMKGNPRAKNLDPRHVAALADTLLYIDNPPTIPMVYFYELLTDTLKRLPSYPLSIREALAQKVGL